MTLRIAIIGGGLGGLSLAVLLQRRGLSCTVHEAREAGDTAEDVGELNLTPTGVSLLEEVLGRTLEDTLLRPVLPVTLVTHSASPLMVLGDAQGPLAGQRRLAYAPLRARLLAAVAPGSVHFGDRVREITQAGGAVDLRFDEGRQLETDLVVGADGAGSLVRRRIWGDAPRSLGLVAAQGTAAPPGALPLGCVGALRVLGNGCSFFAQQAEPGGPIAWQFSRRGLGTELAGLPPAALRDEVAARTSDWSVDVRPLLELSPDASLSTSELCESTLPEALSMGGVTLLGEAAHAVPPFLELGGETALQEAMLLSELLSEPASEPRTGATPLTLALRQAHFDRQARALAKPHLERARFNATLFHLEGPFARFVRDSSLRLLEAGMQGASTRGELPSGD